MNKTNVKKTILIDLDGVLNTYSGEYDSSYIPPIRQGAYEFVKELSKLYRIVVFTSRNLLLVSKWIIEHKLEPFIDNVSNVKEPSYLIIDDRCINFSGNFNILKDNIDKFQVFYK